MAGSCFQELKNIKLQESTGTSIAGEVEASFAATIPFIYTLLVILDFGEVSRDLYHFKQT